LKGVVHENPYRGVGDDVGFVHCFPSVGASSGIDFGLCFRRCKDANGFYFTAGPTLWNVIQASGGIATNPAVKNDSLNKYVIATGADGYKSIVSVGEISPNFGNKSDLLPFRDPQVTCLARTAWRV
jgi:hypothetical protein